MRSFTLLHLLRRVSVLALLAMLSIASVTPPASASIAILLEPFDESKVPVPDDDDDDEIELPKFEFEIDPPSPGPGDDTPPGPEYPWLVVIREIVPGLIDLTGRPIGGDSTEEEEEEKGPEWVRLTLEGSEIAKGFIAAGQLARPGNGNNNNNNGGNDNDDNDDNNDNDDNDNDNDDNDNDNDDNDNDDNDNDDNDNDDSGNDNNNGGNDNDDNNGNGNGGDGEDRNKPPSFTTSAGSIRWETLGLRMLGNGQALWTLRAEAFSMPDMPGLALRFRLRFLISQDKVDIGVNLSSARLRREFRRGKVQDDGPLGMTDGIKILEQLFNQKGEEDPAFCWDAADTNADGEVELRDAMQVFNHLYLGGPEPAQPFHQAGHGKLIDDALACPSTRNDLLAELVVPAWADVARGELAADGGHKCTQGSTKCISHFMHTCDADGNWTKNSPAEQCGGSGVVGAPVETETVSG